MKKLPAGLQMVVVVGLAVIWSGASTSSGDSVTITINSNQMLTANFEEIVVVRGTFTDSRNKKKYRTVKIGDLTWMAENLNYKRGYFTWCYENNENNCRKYGRLYTWDNAMHACPAGWRLPAREDWNNLIEIAGGDVVAYTRLRSTTGWDKGGTDDFGFSAMPGGLNLCNKVGDMFVGAGHVGFWWSATEDGKHYAWKWGMANSRLFEFRHDKYDGFSVRCVQ
jgi:uncharacterized protein (TIGR02145 family)